MAALARRTDTSGVLEPGRADAETRAAAFLDAAVLEDRGLARAIHLLLEAHEALDEVLHGAARERLRRVLAAIHLARDEDGDLVLAGEAGEVVQLLVQAARRLGFRLVAARDVQAVVHVDRVDDEQAKARNLRGVEHHALLLLDGVRRHEEDARLELAQLAFGFLRDGGQRLAGHRLLRGGVGGGGDRERRRHGAKEHLPHAHGAHALRVDVGDALARLGGLAGALQREVRLAGAAFAEDEGDGVGLQAAVEQRVERGASGGQVLHTDARSGPLDEGRGRALVWPLRGRVRGLAEGPPRRRPRPGSGERSSLQRPVAVGGVHLHVRTLVTFGLITALVLAGAPLAAAKKDEAAFAVVALHDDGINPYHIAFRDDSRNAQMYPGKYIPDYPAGALPLRLTFDAPTLADALEADCPTWESVRSGQLYWIPGTKIIGGVEEFTGEPACARNADGSINVLNTMSRLPILGLHHGTMVASRAAADEYGACPECRIVVLPDRNLFAINWSKQNADWIDVDSWSGGAIVGVDTFCLLYCVDQSQAVNDGDPDLSRAVEENAQAHLSFAAAGNGVGLLVAPTPVPNPSATWYTHTPSVLVVGGHDSGFMTTWPGIPSHVVSDSCHSWGAQWDTLDVSGATLAGGTSGAAPFVAGEAARILLEARRILGDGRTGVHEGIVAEGAAGLVESGPLVDGVFTFAEWKRLVLVSASARPEAQVEDGPACALPSESGFVGATPVAWKDVPPGFPEFLQIGYGAVDRNAEALAGAVLRGEVPAPDRTVTDAYFLGVGAANDALYLHFSGALDGPTQPVRDLVPLPDPSVVSETVAAVGAQTGALFGTVFDALGNPENAIFPPP